MEKQQLLNGQSSTHLYNEESLVSLEVARKETRDTLMGKKIEGKSRVKLVGEQRSNLPNDTDVSYYSWL